MGDWFRFNNYRKILFPADGNVDKSTDFIINATKVGKGIEFGASDKRNNFNNKHVRLLYQKPQQHSGWGKCTFLYGEKYNKTAD